MRYRHVLLAATSLAGPFQLPAHAQDAAQPTGTAEIHVQGDRTQGDRIQGDRAARGYQPLRTTLAGGTDRPILDIPQSVSVVPPQVLRDQQARTLDEALANVAGITQANTLGGTQDAFLRRGFGDNRDGSIMRDGLRTAFPRAFDATAERVEVLKGPATLLYGILDPGGMINIITRKPEMVARNTLELRAGSYFGGRDGGGATVDMTGPIGTSGFAYRFIADGQFADYWRQYGMNRNGLIAPSITYFGADTTVRVYAQYSRYSVPFDRGTIFDPTTGRPVPVSPGRRLDERFNVTEGETHIAGIEAEHRFNANWFLRTHYAYSQNTYTDNQARVISYNPATGVLTRRVDATQGSTLDVHAFRMDLSGRERIFGFTNEILAGIAYDYSNVLRTDMIRSTNVAGFNIFNPVYGTLQPSYRVSAADSDQTERLQTAAAYFQNTLWLTDRLSLVGGARVQSYSQYAGKGRPFVVNTDAQGTRVTPRFGLLYKLSPAMSVYASYTESFKPNSSIAQAIGALPPEEGRSYEVGVKIELAAGLTATAALFDITKRNVLYTETIGGTTIARTAGRVHSRGFEVEVAGSLTERLSVIANYAYTDLRVLDDPTLPVGVSLPNVAGSSGAFFLSYDFGVVGTGRLRAGGGARYVGRRPGDATNSFFLPDYGVVDLFASYEMALNGKPLTWQLNIKNLLNRTYYPSAVNNLNVAVGEPFQATLSARVNF